MNKHDSDKTIIHGIKLFKVVRLQISELCLVDGKVLPLFKNGLIQITTNVHQG